ncbi:MAG: primosomal protein N' family DNA-binding protein [Acidimicrobiales bacterium]
MDRPPPPPGRLVRVVPDVAAIHRTFDYLVPPELAADVGVGSRVRIQLHGRRVGGWVVEDDAEPTPGVSPRPLAGSSGLGPPPPVVALARWAAWRWAGSPASFLGTASPARVVRALPEGEGADGEVPEVPVGIPSPGGGAVAMVEEALAASDGGRAPAVVRLAPALDSLLVVRELLHRVGPAGVLVLAPTRARAHQVATRLEGAGVSVAELPEAWAPAAAGRSVVVGTRSAAWAPLGRMRAAVVLDAHEEAYIEERAPTWSAVEVVVERGRRDGCCVLLVTPCPPLSMVEGRTVVATPRGVERRGWPIVEIVDRKGDDPRSGLFSGRLSRLLDDALREHEGRVVCILNRTGRVRLLACAGCGGLARCTRCGGPVAQALARGELACRRCGASRPAMCALCDSTRLKALRMGVSRAAEELSALTGVEAVEVTGRSDPAQPIGGRLVVGTEAALFRVDHAQLVAFLDMDQHLLAPRYRAGEESLALLALAARVVGGRDAGGRILVQTGLAEHDVLTAAARADPARTIAPERAIRRMLGLPPFGALATVVGPGAPELAGRIGGVEGVSVSRTGDERWSLRAVDQRTLCDALARLGRPAGRVRIEVDPTDA